MHAIVVALALLLGNGTEPRFDRVDRVLAALPVGHDEFRVVATIVRDHVSHAWPDSSVETLRIINRRGECLYSESYNVSNGPAAVLNAGVVVEAWPMRWAGGRGFKLRDEPWIPGIGNASGLSTSAATWRCTARRWSRSLHGARCAMSFRAETSWSTKSL